MCRFSWFLAHIRDPSRNRPEKVQRVCDELQPLGSGWPISLADGSMFRKPRRRRVINKSVRQRILVVGALVILVIAGALGWARWSREPAASCGRPAPRSPSLRELRVAGRVVERLVEEGGRLEAGTLVGRLESRELEAEVERLSPPCKRRKPSCPAPDRDCPAGGADPRPDRRGPITRRPRREGRPSSEPAPVARSCRGLAPRAGKADAIMENSQSRCQRMRLPIPREGLASRNRLGIRQKRHSRSPSSGTGTAFERLDLTAEGRPENPSGGGPRWGEPSGTSASPRTGELEVALRSGRSRPMEGGSAGIGQPGGRERHSLATPYSAARRPASSFGSTWSRGDGIAGGTPACSLGHLGDVWLRIYVREPQPQAE